MTDWNVKKLGLCLWVQVDFQLSCIISYPSLCVCVYGRGLSSFVVRYVVVHKSVKCIKEWSSLSTSLTISKVTFLVRNYFPAWNCSNDNNHMLREHFDAKRRGNYTHTHLKKIIFRMEDSLNDVWHLVN